MEYDRYHLREELVIKSIITFYYMELTRQYNNTVGEHHDFWELVYVDKGKIDVYTDLNKYELSQGDIVFYRPNEFHRGRAQNDTAPNLIIISFDCPSQSLNYFAGKSFKLGKEEREILSRLISEGIEAFDPPINSPHMSFPKAKTTAPFGSEQIIKNYLEILLIRLIRRMISEQNENFELIPINGDNKSKELTDRIIAFMKNNISKSITPEQICQEFSISRTGLMKMFKLYTGTSVKEYFNKLKIAHARSLIREEQHNFTQIADILGYSSVHYFSKHFKALTDMTPTEYARSVQAKAGN